MRCMGHIELVVEIRTFWTEKLKVRNILRDLGSDGI
jgi:hypothetical protein